jgi:hypothetical protein
LPFKFNSTGTVGNGLPDSLDGDGDIEGEGRYAKGVGDDDRLWTFLLIDWSVRLDRRGG